jgi:methyl-accepting chemotaxis protein
LEYEGIDARFVYRAIGSFRQAWFTREVQSRNKLSKAFAVEEERFVIRRAVIKPLLRVKALLQGLAEGDLTRRLEIQSEDEVGQMAAALNTTVAKISEVVRQIGEESVNEANASEEFSAVSQQISANSEETSAQANVVSSATEQVNRGLQTVASATEEMTASIREIAKNATEAAKVADHAMKTALETNAVGSKLGESSAEIGQVIKVITSIAQKTDLLALNATVEAARAGEVGAGFAVVANAVKELAKQTAAATEDISRKIEAIQADAKGAVEAIGSISGVIGQVNNISGTIATAVEEQSATTSEMSRSVSEAAKAPAKWRRTSKAWRRQRRARPTAQLIRRRPQRAWRRCRPTCAGWLGDSSWRKAAIAQGARRAIRVSSTSRSGKRARKNSR